MIIVRNVFRVRFGKTKEATEHWKQVLAVTTRGGYARDARLLTDVAGLPFYTLVVELSFDSIAEMEKQMQEVMSSSEWRAAYEKVTPLIESGHREILRVID